MLTNYYNALKCGLVLKPENNQAGQDPATYKKSNLPRLSRRNTIPGLYTHKLSEENQFSKINYGEFDVETFARKITEDLHMEYQKVKESYLPERLKNLGTQMGSTGQNNNTAPPSSDDIGAIENIQSARQEYETWQLVTALINAENLHQKYSENKPQFADKVNPRTVRSDNLLSNKRAMIINAVANWLESTYFKSDQYAAKNQQNPFSSSPLAKDLKLLQVVFNHLRAGRLIEAQTVLHEQDESEKFLWLIGNQSHFDNSQSCVAQHQHLVNEIEPTDIETDQNTDSLLRKAGDQILGQDDTPFYSQGNRTNLMFVQTCLDHIEQTIQMLKSGDQGNYQMSEIEKQIHQYECAILGLQCGHEQAVNLVLQNDDILTNINKKQNQNLTQIETHEQQSALMKARMWSTCRCLATQFNIRKQIKSCLDKTMLNDYETLYSDFMSTEDYKWLEHSLQQVSSLQNVTGVEAADLKRILKGNFNHLGWFETIQLELIAFTVKHSQFQPYNIWKDFLKWLQSGNSPAECRFKVHMAILLILHDRVEETGLYNRILNEYLESISDQKDIHNMTTVGMLPFYSAFLYSASEVCLAQAKLLNNIKDEALIAYVKKENHIYFNQDFCKRLLQAIPEQAFYAGADPEQWQHLQIERVQAYLQLTQDISQEDQDQIDVLKWLASEHRNSFSLDEFAVVYAHYNKLARKFLIEGKIGAAQSLMLNHFPNDINDMQKMYLQNELSNNAFIVQESNNMTTFYSQNSKDAMDVDTRSTSELCLIAYERERLRIIDLCFVLLKGLTPHDEDLVTNADELEHKCLELISWSQLPVFPSICMLESASDIPDSVTNDPLRASMLHQLSQVFLIQVLEVLFKTQMIVRKDMHKCLNFIVDVKRRQPMVKEFLSDANYSEIAQWQSRTMLSSASIMHEVLLCQKPTQTQINFGTQSMVLDQNMDSGDYDF